MSAPVQHGDILADKYCVEEVIGQGGMGVVVAARHVQLGQKVALKFLLPAACADASAVARFLREAQAAFRIQSEHVARILDVGTLASGAPFMVMEFLSGSDLAALSRERGPLPVEEAVGYVLQACEAIAEAHSRGIVHRDLKPANLFLTHRPDGSSLVKVLDFGISKATGTMTTDDGAASVTATTALLGSPAYVSPEQVRSSKHVDARTDIWALGVVIHQLVSGHIPFDGQSITEIMAMIVADPPTPLRAVQPNAPPELESLILRCLEKDPAKRTPNVAVLAQELAPFALPSDRLSVERVMRVLGQPATGSGTVQAPAGAWSPGAPRETTKSAWGETSGYAPKRRPTVAIVAGVAGMVAVLGAGAFLALRRPPPGAGSAEGERAGVAVTAANPLNASKPSPQPPLADRPMADFGVEGAGLHPASPDAADAARPEPPGLPAATPMTRAAPSPVRRSVGTTPKGHPPVAAQPGAPADMFDDTK